VLVVPPVGVLSAFVQEDTVAAIRAEIMKTRIDFMLDCFA